MITESLKKIKSEIPSKVCLVAVSKTKPNTSILEAYNAGQRDFGENKVQELVEKWEALPKDISWHMIGRLQRNKVKYIAEFVDLIHGVDSVKLLKEINKQAKKHQRTIDCLLQIKIASEETKAGFTEEEVTGFLSSEELQELKNIQIVGFMGMATFTTNQAQIKNEFSSIKEVFDKIKPNLPNFNTLSIGMSGDYKIAIQCGSTMIRVGSAIFGNRKYMNL